jgi:hypothetical protein
MWLQQVASNESLQCPTIRQSMTIDCISIDVSLIELRTLITAKQIQIALHIWRRRINDCERNVDDGSTINILYGAYILDFAHNCINMFNHDIDHLHIKSSTANLKAWLFLFCSDVLQLCTLLCDPITIPQHHKSARLHLCTLHMHLCSAVRQCCFCV